MIRSLFYILFLTVFNYGQTIEPAKPPPVEFRLLDANPDSPETLRLPVDGERGQTVAVKPAVIVTGADIKTIKTRTEKFWVMFKRYERSTVEITFGDAGAERLNAAIQNNPGELMAIVIDGSVVTEVLLKDRVKGNIFVLATGSNRAEAVRLSRLLRKK